MSNTLPITAIANLFSAVEAALNTSPAVCNVVARSKNRPFGISEDLAVNIKPGPSIPEQPTFGDPQLQLVTSLSVECYARTTSAVPYDIAVDGLLSAVVGRLHTSPLLTQRPGLLSLELGPIEYDAETHGDQVVCLTLAVTITHRSTTSLE